jgi:hypothetical protein
METFFGSEQFAAVANGKPPCPLLDPCGLSRVILSGVT